jgi:perosamine synthetase
MSDLLHWADATMSRRDHMSELSRVLRDRFTVRHCFFTSTGRAGLTILLRALKRLGDQNRDEVIIPSYTCFSVPASIVRAGLRPRIVDVVPGTLDFDFNSLTQADFRTVLAVIATNLYGLPNDLPRIVDIGRQQGIFVIDDAAQSMGGMVGGRFSGTWGDAGLFSFDKGKNVSAIDGGVVVTSSDAVAGAVEAEMASAVSPRGFSGTIKHVVKAGAYASFLRPSLYWLPNRIPQLKLGTTLYTTSFPLEQMGRSVASLAGTMLNRLDSYNNQRGRNATALVERLSSVAGVSFPRPSADASPVFLRLPMLVTDPAMRRVLLEQLNLRGIGATGSYPASVADIPELAGTPGGSSSASGGRAIAERIVTLPTHPYVTPADLDLICDTTLQVLHGGQEAEFPRGSVVNRAAAGR